MEHTRVCCRGFRGARTTFAGIAELTLRVSPNDVYSPYPTRTTQLRGIGAKELLRMATSESPPEAIRIAETDR